MIKKCNKAAMLQKLKALQSKVTAKEGIPIILRVLDWLDSDDPSPSFYQYYTSCKSKNPNAPIIVDSMCVESDMYLDTCFLMGSDKDTVRNFVNLAEIEDDILYMEAYIDLFNSVFDSENFHDMRRTLEEENHSMLLDFFDNYKISPIKDLIQRYEDQQFFRMI